MPEIRAKILVDASQPLGAIDRIRQALQSIKEAVVRPKVDVEGAKQSAERFSEELSESVRPIDLKSKIRTEQAFVIGQQAGQRFAEGMSFGMFVAADMIGNVLGNALNNLMARVVDFGKSIIDASSEVEQLSVSFEVLLGSRERAQALLKDIREYAATTPYEIGDLTRVAQTMLSFGIPAEKIMSYLRALGDVAMGSGEKLQSLGLAFAQVQSSGRLMGQDLMQMINAGFNPLQVISEKTGISIGELKEKMEDGAISAELVANAFVAATSESGKFFNMSQKQSQTFAGLMSTLRDNITQIGVAIGKDIFDKLKEFTARVVDFIDRIQNAYKSGGLYNVFTTIFPPAIGAVVYGTLKNIVSVIEWLAKALWALKPLWILIGASVGTWLMVGKTISIVTGAVSLLRTTWLGLNAVMASNPFIAIASTVIGVAVLIITYWENIKKFFVDLWEGIKQAFVDAIRFIVDAIELFVRGTIDTITLLNPIGFVVRTMKGDWGVFQSLLNTLKNAFGDTFEKIYTSVRNTITRIIDWFKNWWKSVEQSGGVIGNLFIKIRLFAEGTVEFIKRIWELLLSFINKVWDKIVGVWNSVRKFFGGGEKTEAKIETSSAVNNLKTLNEEKDKSIEKSQTLAKEEQKLDFSLAETKKKNSENERRERERAIEQAKEYIRERRKELEVVEEISKTQALEERLSVLSRQKEIVQDKLSELKAQKDINETIDEQIVLLEQIARINKEVAETEAEKRKMAIESKLQEALEREQEAYEKARANARGNRDLMLEVERAYNEKIMAIYAEASSELLELERQKNEKLLRAQEDYEKERERLAKQQAEKEKKAREEAFKKEVEKINETQKAFAGVYEPVKITVDTAEIDRQIEELDKSFLKGQIVEEEYTRRRQELSKQRQADARAEAKAFELAFSKAFEKALEMLKTTDSEFVRLSKSMDELVVGLAKSSKTFADSLVENKDASESFSKYFESVAQLIQDKWKDATDYIALQTSLMATQMITQGVPALQAFKKAFLLTLLDMVEKTVVSQLPAITALINSVIPFPASLPVVAAVTATLMTMLEMAKAKIRGAERGYLKGYREGERGASDTMLIYINPREAILPVYAVERNRETIKMMLQGVSFDKAIENRELAKRLLASSQRNESLNRLMPATNAMIRVRIENEIGFKPLRFRGDEIIINAERRFERIHRLKR